MRLATLTRLCALALVAALVTAAPALAAGDAHGGGGGMLDKMKFTGIHRWDLGLYTLIVFGLLMFILSKFAWPKIKAGLEAREKNVRGALDEAKRERAEAAALMARAKKEIDETAGKVRAMLDEARADAEALKTAKTEEGEREAQAIKDRATRDAALKLEGQLKEVEQQAVQLAMLIATKALRQQVTADNQQKLLDEAIAELGTHTKHA